jgi:hypothetical protein
MTPDELDDYKNSLALMGADELRGMKGDDPELDKLIDAQLASGKAPEMKTTNNNAGGPSTSTSNGNGDGSEDQRVVERKKPTDGGDDDDEDEDDPNYTGFVDEHGRPVPDPNGPKAAADTAAAAAAAAQATADATASTEAAAAAAATAANPGDTGAVVEIAPLDLSGLNGHLQSKLAALDAEKAAKFKDLMEGNIEPEEYSTFESQYLANRDAAKTEVQALGEWYKEIHQFKVDAAKNSGINYDTDTEKANSWDAWVKHLANKHPEKGDSWALAEAHRKVMIEYNIAPATAKPAPAVAQPVVDAKKDAKKQGRAPDLSQIPPTIGALPSATSLDGGDGGEFAHLDSLTGMDYERALARLTPDQKARYEAA